MPLRSFRHTLFIIALLFLFSMSVTAQEKQDTSLVKSKGSSGMPAADTQIIQAPDTLTDKKEERIILKSNVRDNSGKSLLSLDTSHSKFNPRTATLRSAILPGWGQWYNKKYWKIPIIYGALGTTTGVFFYNLKTYKLLRQAVIYLSDTDTTNDKLVDPEFGDLSLGSIRNYRNAYRQNIDYSVLVFLIFWGLNVVDATVDAQLKAFDVSPDISMKIRPDFNYLTRTPGISVVFFFKEKSPRPILPR